MLFRSYIDDIFTIIIESSEEAALAYAKSKLAFPDLCLKWEVDTYRMVFLDLEVTHVLSTGKFDYRPYCKLLNHFERISFSSGHTKWMKKGTILGKLSRLVALSSNTDIYRLAAEELAYIYLSCEYPLSLVKEWLSNFHERWETRYSVVSKGETDNMMIIKRVLNSMWDSIDERNIQ